MPRKSPNACPASNKNPASARTGMVTNSTTSPNVLIHGVEDRALSPKFKKPATTSPTTSTTVESADAKTANGWANVSKTVPARSPSPVKLLNASIAPPTTRKTVWIAGMRFDTIGDAKSTMPSIAKASVSTKEPNASVMPSNRLFKNSVTAPPSFIPLKNSDARSKASWMASRKRSKAGKIFSSKPLARASKKGCAACPASAKAAPICLGSMPAIMSFAAITTSLSAGNSSLPTSPCNCSKFPTSVENKPFSVCDCAAITPLKRPPSSVKTLIAFSSSPYPILP